MRLQKILKGQLHCLAVIVAVAMAVCLLHGLAQAAENGKLNNISLSAPKQPRIARGVRKQIDKNKMDEIKGNTVTAPRVANRQQRVQKSSAGRVKINTQANKVSVARRGLRRIKAAHVNTAITAPKAANQLQKVQKSDAGNNKLKLQANTAGSGKQVRLARTKTARTKPATQVRVTQKKGLVANLQGLKRQIGNALKGGRNTMPEQQKIERMPLTNKQMSFKNKAAGLSVNKPAGIGVKTGSTSGPSFTAVEGTIRK